MAWDSPLSALEGVVTAASDLDRVGAGEGGLRLDAVVVSMPLELQTEVTADGEVGLAVSPPRQAIVTTVMPVLHQLTLRVEVSS